MSMSAHGGSGATSAGRGGSGATSAASIAGEFLASLDGRQAEREAEERRLVERLWGEYADAASRPAPFERIGQLVATREVHPRELARIERYVRERVPRDKRSAALVGSFKARCRELGVAWQRQK